MSKKISRILWMISIVSFIGQLILYPRLPAIVPVHWNSTGRIDGWGPKWFLLAMSAMPLVSMLFFSLVPLLDPRRRNYPKHSKAYGLFAAATVGIMLLLLWLTNLLLLGIPLPVGNLILFAAGVMMVVLGNYMPQIRSNFFFGLKTPWGIENETVWRKTQRLAGILYCIGGAVLIIISLFPTQFLVAGFLAMIILMIIVPRVYAYILYRKITSSQEDSHAEHS